MLDYLSAYAIETPDHDAFIFLKNNEVENSVTYLQLEKLTDHLAQKLKQKWAIGDRVILAFPQCMEFVVTYFACLKAGLVVVPVSIPGRSRGVDTLQKIIVDSQATGFYTNESTHQRLLNLFPGFLGDGLIEAQTIDWVDMEQEINSLRAVEPFASDKAWLDYAPELAMLQYTSGSTGDPKGVMVTHENLVQNQELMQVGFGLRPQDRIGTWLPLFHDMGLIGAIFQAIYLGGTAVVMSPSAFIKQPIQWLQMISRYRITVAGCPNFGYDACVKRIKESALEGISLATWRVAFSGAELIRQSTMQQFIDKFHRYGLKPDALAPCYGLAEATLYVSSLPPHSNMGCQSVSVEELQRGRVVITGSHEVIPSHVEAQDTNASSVVSCGVAQPSVVMKIVDPATSEILAEGNVGEVWVSSHHIAKGYWGREEATEATFHARLKPSDGRHYLRTGDLGFLLDGQLYLTGRSKEMLIVNGRNIYPNDIENTVADSFREVFRDAIGAFQVDDKGTESAVVIAEVGPSKSFKAQSDEIAKTIKSQVSKEFGIAVKDVMFVKRSTIPKTTSGKLQRTKLKQQYISNEIEAL
ncbi:hypothetical protein NBRC116495_34010 [Aurantivibrio plasticivorans]